ncbi:unnamed protein product [Wuchereria bancrofti]|uniref:Prenylcysteine lyase domain-containing protein n=2 Tax=Wuchereria bancrofti TaxID=6293 RepID=A0A3P7DNT9_WUCBA|nr:unnamed protein product [Wuchereria bancrofti]
MKKQKVGWMEEFDVRCFGVMVFRLLGFILRRVCNAEFFANLLIGVARNVAKFSRLVKSFRNIDYQWRHWRCIFCIFLRTLAPLDTNIEIHLFNQGIIGGRLTTIQMPYSDQIRTFEAGGSILHPANLYFKNWMEKLGKHIEWSEICLSGKFMGRSFDNVDAMVMVMSSHLAKLINNTIKEYLADSGYHDPFSLEFTNAALNCNYGQSVKEIRVFVGFVGLAGSVSGLYSVNGSNKLILVKEERGILKSNLIISFVLYGNDSQELCANYNYIIVAVPLHQKQQIQIEVVNWRTSVGTLRAKHWLLSENDILTVVIACNNRQISPVDDYEGSEFSPKTGSNKIWKIFSKYKEYPADRPKFRIAKNICFVNAVEWLASTAEMSAIGSRNCVNMLLRDFGLIDVNKTTKMEL